MWGKGRTTLGSPPSSSSSLLLLSWFFKWDWFNFSLFDKHLTRIISRDQTSSRVPCHLGSCEPTSTPTSCEAERNTVFWALVHGQQVHFTFWPLPASHLSFLFLLTPPPPLLLCLLLLLLLHSLTQSPFHSLWLPLALALRPITALLALVRVVWLID